MKKTKTMQVRMSECLWQALTEKAIADTRGRTVSDIVRDAIMKQEPDVYKRASELAQEWRRDNGSI